MHKTVVATLLKAPPPTPFLSCFCCWTSTLKNHKVSVRFLLSDCAAAQDSVPPSVSTLVCDISRVCVDL